MSYRRPRFVREESWRYKRVKESWRAPHGKTSRVRRSKKGWPAVVKVGYSKPRAIRGLHPSGLRPVAVWRPRDLEELDSKIHIGVIAHTVGENKRVQILDAARKANIRILNPGLKKPAEAAPSAVPEPSTTGQAQETKEEEKKEAKPEEERPKRTRAKAKAKTTKRKPKK